MIHIQGIRSIAMRMYIRQSEEDFGLERKDLETIEDGELMDYIDYLDELHDK